MKRLKSVLAVAALAWSAPSMAAVCTGGYGLGTMGPPGAAWFGQAFSSAGSYLDCYSFSLSSASDSFGGTIELDPWLNKLDIDLTTISLFSGGVHGGAPSGALIGSDDTPGLFSFGSLATGTYTLTVSSKVTRDAGLWNAPVGYVGLFATNRASVASPAPEPESMALMLAGLAGVAAAVRRRRKP
jgi:PEP-CTERM motif